MRLLLAFLVMSFSALSSADVYVRGHFRKNGTYVRPHYRSSPDSSVFNNYSTKGNVNPYTGRRGTKDPYRIRDSYQYTNDSWGYEDFDSDIRF